jgi:hypothetical protein
LTSAPNLFEVDVDRDRVGGDRQALEAAGRPSALSETLVLGRGFA